MTALKSQFKLVLNVIHYQNNVRYFMLTKKKMAKNTQIHKLRQTIFCFFGKSITMGKSQNNRNIT